MTDAAIAAAVSAFGVSTKGKLAKTAISGAPEDQLRAPLEALILQLSEIGGLPKGAVDLIGETSLADIKTRPDYAVVVQNALVGFIEVKAPGKGADPTKFKKDSHDGDQWAKLKALPNLIYTDGNSFSLWRDGERDGEIIHLDGDVENAGSKLGAPPGLMLLIGSFLGWKPIAPKDPKKLAEISARLCRLLRDEVVEQMKLKHEGLTKLAQDWRKLLFPQADDTQFADGYAQAVTFGLLVAKARGISLASGIDHAAVDLKKTNSLIGTALSLMTDDDANQKALRTSLRTLTRVLDTVDWSKISKDEPDAWLYFYEIFLEVYDNTLRKKTGSYYTPPEVVSAMVRLVDDALRGPLFKRAKGLAAGDVTIADPAVGTGTFLLGVLRKIADSVAADEGTGAVKGAIEAAAKRLIGFELQFGPFAVAQLRMIAEFHDLLTGDEPGKTKEKKPVAIPDLRLFITDTLGNPYVEEETLVQAGPVAKSRRDANEIKKGQPITVVIGNPPYKEKAKGRGGWVESGTSGRQAPMDRWTPPKSWGVGAHAKHLKNLYIYFWRWATWKVFATGLAASTQVGGGADPDEEGIVCFITVAGFLNGPGFQKMRDDLRRTCSDIWVIDCSPEGHQPSVATRIFQGVKQPVCIVLAARQKSKDAKTPARLLYRALPQGARTGKFEALAKISLEDGLWEEGPTVWRAPFLPAARGAWANFIALDSLFEYDGSGVMPGRTWIITPDANTLEKRWNRLIRESDKTRKETLFHPHLRKGQPGDKHLTKVVSTGLTGHQHRPFPVDRDVHPATTPVRYAFRSLDRQWIIPDARLINQPNPELWKIFSSEQVYLTAPSDRSPSNGPALTATSLIPDLHHYNGRGGRVFPLWRDAAATSSNIRPALLDFLTETYGKPVTPEDVMAYIAGLLSHPAFTKRFKADLVQPGLRVPMTADASLFAETAALGKEAIWLQTYGERFADAGEGRPSSPPRLPHAIAPRIPAEGAIPSAPEPLPDTMSYDAAKRRLHIGKGFVENVTPEMWAYEISGKQVLKQWFSYRRLDRSKPPMGDKRPPSPLEEIKPDGWLAEYTSDLIDLLHVLGRLIALEPRQADMLARVCDGPLLGLDDLAGIVGTDDAAQNAAEESKEAT